jgi:hypothetical protein
MAYPDRPISGTADLTHEEVPMQRAQRRKPVPGGSRREGLAYARDEGGRELPVIDVSHPAFALDPSEVEIQARVDDAIAQMAKREKSSSFAQRLVFKVLAKRSVLAGSLSLGPNTFVGGMPTYRLKLGPGNLDPRWATPIDFSFADALPCYSARLRLRDTATLLSEALVESLGRAPRKALHLVNVAGGAAADSLNALILARRSCPGLLEERPIRIHLLDLDEDGASFAGRALSALTEPGGALCGLDVRLSWTPYDWKDPCALRELGAAIGEEGSACALSSEGGLFEYGSDEVIEANLSAFAAGFASGVAVSGAEGAAEILPWVGTISRVEGKAAFLNGASGAAIRLRPRRELEEAIARSGYRLTRAVDCPLSTSFALERARGQESSSPA